MSTPNAAREKDQIIHASIWADLASVVMEGVVYAGAAMVVVGAATLAAPALAAGSAAAAVVGFAGGCIGSGLISSTILNYTGLGDKISEGCSELADAIFPPSPAGVISTGSDNVKTNSKPAARAAGRLLTEAEIAAQPKPPEPDSLLDYAQMLLGSAGSFVSELIRPTVGGPDKPTAEAEHDRVDCEKHSPIEYIAEGSDKVSINDLPAVRSKDRTTCDATVSENVSKNVHIGGGSVVVRTIKSGKLPGFDLLFMAASLMMGRPKNIFKKLPCLFTSMAVGMATDRLINAAIAVFNPVHAATGAKTLSGEDELDFMLPARYPLIFQRMYNSRNPHSGLFGQGWSTEFEVSVSREAEYYCYLDAGGRELRFEPPVTGVQNCYPAEGLIIAAGDNGLITIGDTDGACWRLFGPSPDDASHLRLLSLSDEYGNGLLMKYDDQQRLAQITDTEGALCIRFLYQHSEHPQRVSHICEHHDNNTRQLISYEYNRNGQVIRVIDTADIVTRVFTYNDDNLLITHETSSGLVCNYQWIYLDDWRVSHYSDNQGEVCEINYDLTEKITRITHKNSLSHTHYWNEQFLVTRYTDEAGNDWHYKWNEYGLLTESCSPLDECYTYFYNEYGCLTEEINPAGQTTLTEWLPERELISAITYPDGARTEFGYDLHHGVIQITDAGGLKTCYERDTYGQVSVVTDAKQGRNEYQYNEFGQQIRHRDCSGQTTRYSYNFQHQLSCITDALQEEFYLEYDAAGRLLKVIGAEGWHNTFHLDKQGRLIRFEEADSKTQSFEWNRAGLLHRTINSLSGTVERSYDERGRLVSLQNENRQSYHFQWGPNDRLIRETGLDGIATQYDYDGCDRMVQRIFAAGTKSALTHHSRYNMLGQMTEKQTPDGITRYCYAKSGALISARFTGTGNSPYSQFVHFTYNKSGSLIQESTLSGVVNYQYDELDNLTNVTLPGAGTLKTLYYGSGHTLQINLNGRVITEFTRDNLHREVSRTQGMMTSGRRYDRLGRITGRTVSAREGNLRPVDDIRWDYDLRHNLVRAKEGTDPYGWKAWQYDDTDRLSDRKSNRYSPERYYYDPASNILEESFSPVCTDNRVRQYQGITYRYDIYGRTTEKQTRTEGRWTYGYDSEHRMISALHTPVAPHEKRCFVEFSYDPLGRRLHKAVNYLPALSVPDFQQRLPLNAHPEGTTTFLWEGLRLLEERRPGNTRMLYVYEDSDSYSPLARIDFHRGKEDICYYRTQPNGLPDSLHDEKGETLWEARFTSWGRAEVELGTLHYLTPQRDQNLRFQGQYLDRETGLHYNTFRYYDPDTGRFTQHDPIGLMGGLNLYQYAPNALGWVDPLGLSVVDAFFEMAGQVFQGSNPTERIPRIEGKTLPGLGYPNSNRFSMHAEIDAMMQAYDKGLRGGKGTLTVDGLPVCDFCKRSLKNMAKHLGLEELIIKETATGKIYTFKGNDLNTMRKGGKGFKGC